MTPQLASSPPPPPAHTVPCAAWATIDPERVDHIDDDLRALVPHEIAARHGCLPLWVVDNRTLVVAVADPTHEMAFDDIHWLTGWRSLPVVAEPAALRLAISRVYGSA